MAGEDDDKGGEATFTRAQMAREVNRQVKEKVAAALAELGDLDELKRKAAQADSQQTQLEKMAGQLDTLTQRAEKAEIDVARARVADELGLTPKEAKRLTGKTYAELKADGDELVDDLGIDVKARKRGESSRGRGRTRNDDDAGDGDDNGRESDERDGDDDDDAGQQETEREQRRPARRQRPRELSPGARVPSGGTEERDPLKLIADVPRVR
jgi:ribonuclease E